NRLNFFENIFQHRDIVRYMLLEQVEMEVLWQILLRSLLKRVQEVLLLVIIRLVKHGLSEFARRNHAALQRTQESPIALQEAFNGLAKCLYARFEALEQQNPRQSAQIRASGLQILVRLALRRIV